MTSRQELKEKIVRELLPNLSVDPRGAYVKSDELVNKVYEDFEHCYFDSLPIVNIDPKNVLVPEDYQEITQLLVDEIKQHANEWKIEPEGKLTIVKCDSGRKHYKEGFAKHRWGQIEQALSQQQTQIQQPPKPNFPFSGSSGNNSNR